jgi:hypothetical protein
LKCYPTALLDVVVCILKARKHGIICKKVGQFLRRSTKKTTIFVRPCSNKFLFFTNEEKSRKIGVAGASGEIFLKMKDKRKTSR